jgi:hypothetical protein
MQLGKRGPTTDERVWGAIPTTDAAAHWSSTPPAKRTKRAGEAGLPQLGSNSQTTGVFDDLWSDFPLIEAVPEDHVDDLLWQLVASPTAPGDELGAIALAIDDDKMSEEPYASSESDSESDPIGMSLDEPTDSSHSRATRPSSPAPPASFGGVEDVAVSGRTPSVGPAHSRKEWLPWEDEAIRQGVEELGTKWRAISARLPGRSDDAVRNRWARLQLSPAAAELGIGGATAGTKPATPRQKRTDAEPRHSWTTEEDLEIIRSVAANGRRWNRIAEKLPRRTEHAIRNRWHRLQMAAIDDRKELSAPASPNAKDVPSMDKARSWQNLGSTIVVA